MVFRPENDAFKYSLVYLVVASNADSRLTLFVELTDQEMWAQVQFYDSFGNLDNFIVTVKFKKRHIFKDHTA